MAFIVVVVVVVCIDVVVPQWASLTGWMAKKEQEIERERETENGLIISDGLLLLRLLQAGQAYRAAFEIARVVSVASCDVDAANDDNES